MAEEVDIITLMKKTSNVIGGFFKKMGKNFLYFIRFSYKNFKLLAVFLLIGVAAGVVYSQYFKVYKADTIVRINIADASMLFDLAKTLDAKVVSEQLLSEKLNLSDSVVDAITSIKPHFIIDYFNNGTPDFYDEKDTFEEKDTLEVKMQDRLGITVETKQLHSFSQIQNGISYFFNTYPAFKEEKEMRQSQLKQAIEYAASEAKRLEKLSEIEYLKEPTKISLSVDTTALLVGEKPRQLYYKDVRKMLQLKDSLEKVLMYSADVISVIKPFTPTKKNENGVVKMSIAFGGFLLILGYIFAAFFKYRKQISKFLNE